MNIKMTTQGDKAVLHIHGRFDFNTHGAFRQFSEQALAAPGTHTIEINLREVDYLDSSALGMLLLLREKAQRSGARQIQLSGATGLVQQVLEVANFSRLFAIS